MNAAAYVRVSTSEQAEGLSLDAQRNKITTEVSRREWHLGTVVPESVSAKNLKRPHLRLLLEDLDAGTYDVLIVARLDRLSRSAGDFFTLVDRASKKGWQILCLDPNFDMTDPFGKAMAGMAAIFAQLERELIAQRQRESVAARKAAGTWAPAGAAVRQVNSAVESRVAVLMGQGMGRDRIAERLTLEGYESPGGGAWSPSTVRNIMARVPKLRDADASRSAS